MNTRRWWLTLIGVVVGAAVVVAVLATLARHRLEAQAVVADDNRAADVVAGIVDSSLEELRERESDRPFDHYNAVYRPEGVVAASDALAPSPLSRAPDDKRVLGWLQLNPDGTTTIPFVTTRPDVAAAIDTRVAGTAFSPLRAMTKAPAVVVADARPVMARARNTNAAGPAPALDATNDKASAVVETPTVLALNDVNSEGSQAQGIVQQLNVASSNVYSQLQDAETMPSKRAALASNSKLPAVLRNDVEVDLGNESRTKTGKKPTKKTYSRKDAVYDDQSPLKAPLAKPKPAPPPAAAKPIMLSPTTLTVDYTPMVFGSYDGALVLQRTVTSTNDGAQTVQLVLLDDDATRAWLDTVVARRVPDLSAVSVVAVGAVADCTLRAPASSILDDVELCFSSPVPPLPLTELGMLLGLLLLVVVVLYVLDHAAKNAEVLARQRSAFISSVSHELRTPLTTLRLHAELLRDGLVTDPTKIERFLDEMVTESVRLSHLVENVLEAQRLEEGRRPLRLAPANFGHVVADVVAGQRALVSQRGFSIELTLPDDDDSEDSEAALVFSFDRQAIEQVVVNLIENAVKYARDACDRRIDVVVRADGGKAVVVVVDRGPGIARHERERVFARFTRVERPGEEHVAGSGLGLALVRELAVAHGGTARITDSAVGCSVEVTLPLRTVGA